MGRANSLLVPWFLHLENEDERLHHRRLTRVSAGQTLAVSSPLLSLLTLLPPAPCENFVLVSEMSPIPVLPQATTAPTLHRKLPNR